MTRRPTRPPLPPEARYRMRRLSVAEMAHLRRLARNGRRGPAKALDALWELIIDEAHGHDRDMRRTLGEREWVQDYSIQRDQSEALLSAMIHNRRLPPQVVSGFHLMWTFHAPSEYDPEDARRRPDSSGVAPDHR